MSYTFTNEDIYLNNLLIQRRRDRKDEACLSVLNNFYGDGVVWHDIACYHKKHFVCEDNPALFAFMRDENPGAIIE